MDKREREREKLNEDELTQPCHIQQNHSEQGVWLLPISAMEKILYQTSQRQHSVQISKLREMVELITV